MNLSDAKINSLSNIQYFTLYFYHMHLDIIKFVKDRTKLLFLISTFTLSFLVTSSIYSVIFVYSELIF